MIKISYSAKPFHTECGLDKPCTKNLEVTFEEDASSVEIVAEIIKLLTYAGYSKPTYEMALNVIDEYLDEGVITDNRKD